MHRDCRWNADGAANSRLLGQDSPGIRRDPDGWALRRRKLLVCEETEMVLKLDVRVPAEGRIELGAWLFLPEGDGIHPAITMAHGFAGTREHGLERFAQAFAAAGFVVLVHDHRNFGTSGGDLRGDVDPIAEHIRATGPDISNRTVSFSLQSLKKSGLAKNADGKWTLRKARSRRARS
jgi:hypothetical protein